MSAIDPKTLKVGDTILARLKVEGVAGDCALVRLSEASQQRTRADLLDIVAIERRPIEVGDKVVYGPRQEPCTVVAIDDDEAWVKSPKRNGWLVFLTDLRRRA